MKKLVRENMSSHLITIGWNESVETAFMRMQKQKIRHLPVHNEVGEILGMLSDRDVQRAMISTIDCADETIEFASNARVRDYMSWPVMTLGHDLELKLVAERMLRDKVSSILVERGGRIVGIVTVEDLLKVLCELLSDPPEAQHWTLASLLDDSLSTLSHTVI
jgi:CBS domain-containing protein